MLQIAPKPKSFPFQQSHIQPHLFYESESLPPINRTYQMNPLKYFVYPVPQQRLYSFVSSFVPFYSCHTYSPLLRWRYRSPGWGMGLTIAASDCHRCGHQRVTCPAAGALQRCLAWPPAVAASSRPGLPLRAAVQRLLRAVPGRRRSPTMLASAPAILLDCTIAFFL